ncbi:MAG: hypothetical protein IT318_07950, partial [Anaerolineales bacterium]|nr:hypothetical protein [Anaerolineales bacterium]
MIPRRFFWLLDGLVCVLAFAAAYSLLPALQTLIVSTGVLQHPWVQALSPTVGSRLPLVRLLWVLGAMTPTTIL